MLNRIVNATTVVPCIERDDKKTAFVCIRLKFAKKGEYCASYGNLTNDGVFYDLKLLFTADDIEEF